MDPVVGIRLRQRPQSVKKVQAECQGRDRDVAFRKFSCGEVHHWLGDLVNVHLSPIGNPSNFVSQLELEDVQVLRAPQNVVNPHRRRNNGQVATADIYSENRTVRLPNS
jgi:hypothetical protein